MRERNGLISSKFLPTLDSQATDFVVIESIWDSKVFKSFDFFGELLLPIDISLRLQGNLDGFHTFWILLLCSTWTKIEQILEMNLRAKHKFR